MAGKELKNGTPGKKPDALLKTLKAGNGLVSALAGLLAVVLILYSGYVLYDSFATEYGAYSDNQDLLKYKPVVMANGKAAEGAEDLSAVNADYRAWLTVDNTQIDYPVVQGRDDLFYASHDAYGGPSLSGAIYLAAANSPNFRDSYSVVYGHHMDNGAMFGSLDRFRDSGYFHEHQTGTVITKDNVYTLTLFAVATTDAYENQVYSVGDRAREVISFLTGDRRGDAGIGTNVLIYDREAAAGAVKVVALSTCADANTNGRHSHGHADSPLHGGRGRGIPDGRLCLPYRRNLLCGIPAAAGIRRGYRDRPGDHHGRPGDHCPLHPEDLADGDPLHLPGRHGSRGNLHRGDPDRRGI